MKSHAEPPDQSHSPHSRAYASTENDDKKLETDLAVVSSMKASFHLSHLSVPGGVYIWIVVSRDMTLIPLHIGLIHRTHQAAYPQPLCWLEITL